MYVTSFCSCSGSLLPLLPPPPPPQFVQGQIQGGVQGVRAPSPKGVYPQSDGSLAIVDIDALKGFVDLWVHLSFAIFAIFDEKNNYNYLRWLTTKFKHA